VTTESPTATLQAFRQREHCNCVVCSPDHDRGMKVHFEFVAEGSVEAAFDCDSMFEGYPRKLHGGVISSLMDGAMAHAMFAKGIAAVTAEMTVRFRHPVATNTPAIVQARVERSRPPLFYVAAELIQEGHVKVTAKGKFVGEPEGQYEPM
jgi:acyl-coenzyme A thioesterase PaaI-like protein